MADALATMPGSGIVYVLTVAETERLAGFLRDRGHRRRGLLGADAEPRGTGGPAAPQRDQGAGGDLGVGHGVRQARPGVLPPPRLAVVAGGLLPAGRAGRAGRWTRLRRCWSRGSSDERIWEYFATAGIPTDEQVRARAGRCSTTGPQSLPAIEAATGIRRGRLETLLKILAVDDVVAREPGGLGATGERPWFYDEAKWSALRRVRSAEADLMRRYAHGEGCLMQFLQQALDDPDPHPCGRCSVCTGELPAPGAGPDPETVAAAQRFFRGQDVIVEPRKLWAPAACRAARAGSPAWRPGRALAFADDPAWARCSPRCGERDGPAPAGGAGRDGRGAAAVVPVVGAAGRGGRRCRPAGSRSWSDRSRSTSRGSAGCRSWTRCRSPVPRRRPRSSSAVRGRELLARTALRDGVRFDGPVLLIDDTIRTRWTVTVASALLVEAGATAVLPLAIHQLP